MTLTKAEAQRILDTPEDEVNWTGKGPWGIEVDGVLKR